MKTSETGHLAEKRVANLLKTSGYKIIDLNWRTSRCEIDIIAEKNKIKYFVEVKFRSSVRQGEGFDYITAKKLNQMRYSAEIWVNDNNYNGDYRLMAASVGGDDSGSVDLVELD